MRYLKSDKNSFTKRSGDINMNHILAVLVGVILLLNLLPCAFAQSNLRNHSDEQRLTVAQQNVGDAATNARATRLTILFPRSL